MISSLISGLVLAGLTCVSLAGYLSPLIVGWTRRAPGIGAIALINVLLGWTLIGWVVALAMALRPASPPAPTSGRLVPPAGCPWWAGPGGPPAPRPGPAPPLNLPRRPPADHRDPGDG